MKGRQRRHGVGACEQELVDACRLQCCFGFAGLAGHENKLGARGLQGLGGCFGMLRVKRVGRADAGGGCA